MSGPRLRTERLRLDPFAPSDTHELLAIFRDPVIRRFLLDGAVMSRAWVAEEIRASRAAFATGGAGLWSLRRGVGDGVLRGEGNPADQGAGRRVRRKKPTSSIRWLQRRESPTSGNQLRRSSKSYAVVTARSRRSCWTASPVSRIRVPRSVQ